MFFAGTGVNWVRSPAYLTAVGTVTFRPRDAIYDFLLRLWGMNLYASEPFAPTDSPHPQNLQDLNRPGPAAARQRRLASACAELISLRTY